MKPEQEKGNLVNITGLPNWQAPKNYNVYTTGEIKGSRTIIKKDAPINVQAFEALPFKHIPSELIID